MVDLRDFIYAEDTAHASGDRGLMLLAVRQDVAGTLVNADGDYAPLQVNADGHLRAILAANSGVDIGDVDVLSVVPGTGATNLGKAEDAAHVTGDVGVLALAVRQDVASALASAGDYIPFIADGSGRLHVAPDTPVNPTNDYITSAAVAAGATANLDSPDIPAKKLTACEVWSSTAYKVEVWRLSNGADQGTEPLVIGGGQAYQAFTWRTPHRDYAVGGTTTAGVDGFRFKVTNLDDAQAADVYVSYHYED